MPNNNPHGHNQYTKAENRSPKSQSPKLKPTESGSIDAPGGAVTTHESDTTNTAGAEQSGAGTSSPSGTSRRGFASMDEATQREIASKGGHSQGRENNPGNFANDREKAREAGRKGGEAHGSHR
jgi:general stress protein YciG